MSTINKIALVGHCGPDSWMLKQVAGSAAPGAKVIMVHSDAELAREGDSQTLLLVNRALDGEFSAPDGIELIRAVKARGGPAAMLISNYPDAQAAAVQAGALPGFGKSKARAEGVPAIHKALGVGSTQPAPK